ncbi:MAG TPA: type IV secretion system protein [Acetobacteraceae bacterium]|nr:type IV secretion system protein [Acetobacteraceae bacterium]
MISSSTFFASLYTALITPLLAQLQAMIGTVISTMAPIAAVMTVIAVAVSGAEVAFGQKTFSRFKRDVAIAAIVVVLATSAYYTKYISDLFLTGIPNTLGNALGATTNPASSLDRVLNTVVKATFEDYHQLPWGLMSIPLGIGLIVILAVTVTCLLFSFGVYMTATIINVVVVLIGPVFLILGITPITRRFTAGWFSVLVGGCITQVLALGVIQLMTTAELTMIQGFITVAAPAAGGDNSIVILWGLTESAMLLGLTAAAVKQVPAISRAIGHGVYHSSAGLQAATFGAARQIAGGAASGAARGVGAVASGVARIGGQSGNDQPWRGKAPVGRSLSRGDR